ncbi:MAG: hypothetical protein NVS4B8_13430 [Herpetosiphon sp.]
MTTPPSTDVPGALQRRRPAMTAYYRTWHQMMRVLVPTLAYVRVEDMHLFPRQGPALLVCNHLSMVDIPLLIAYMPRHVHFMSKAELFDTPLKRAFFAGGQPIPVKRGKVDRAALRLAESYLRAGEVVGLFAEGHRSESGLAQQARAGVVYLAQRTGASIAPVGISGTERVSLPHFPWYRHTRVVLRVGAPFQLADLPAMREPNPGRERLAWEVMARVAALLPEQYRGMYAAPPPSEDPDAG